MEGSCAGCLIGILVTIVCVCLVVFIVFASILSNIKKSLEPEEINPYDYPEEFTAEYCYENYELVDRNLVYLYGYDKTKSSVQFSGSKFYFAAIKDVELNDFISLVKLSFGNAILVRDTYNVAVVRKKGNTIDPIQDFTVKKIELFWRNGSAYSIYKNNDTIDNNKMSVQEKILQYGVYIFNKSIKVIDDKEMMSDILSYARCEKTNDLNEYNNDELNRSNTEFVMHDNLYLSVRIYFEECENLVWDALVYKGEDGYYIERFYYEPSDELKNATAHRSDYFLLSDSLNEMIDDLLNK